MVLFTVPEQPTAEDQESDSVASNSNNLNSNPKAHYNHHDSIQDLKRLEATLKSQVDADFFLDPLEFRTLSRVIDILGAQLLETETKTHATVNVNSNVNGNSNGNTNKTGPDGRNLTGIPHLSLAKLHNNPAYIALKKQQTMIESTIEHLTMHHYTELNASVVAVGQVSQKFENVVDQVHDLKRQVQEIRLHLTTSSASVVPDPGGSLSIPSIKTGTKQSDASHVVHSIYTSKDTSLRELWLKKLECEAVLSLLQKIELVREAPHAFDILVHSNPCRIGAAVVLLMNALETMFHPDVTQIQGLSLITEQLMMRRQKAEEILWETLQDMIYLRTGTGNHPTSTSSNLTTHSQPSLQINGLYPSGESVAEKRRKARHGKSSSSIPSRGGNSTTTSNSNNSSGNNHRNRMAASSSAAATTASAYAQKKEHPKHYISLYLPQADYNQEDDYEDDVDYEEESSFYYNTTMEDHSMDDFHEEQHSIKGSALPEATSSIRSGHPNMNQNNSTASNLQDTSSTQQQGYLLSKSLLLSELSLEMDELRCLENWNSSSNSNYESNTSMTMAYSTLSSDTTLVLPRYSDPILGLRILIEALAKLKRLDDVERVLSENLERELKRISQMEQAKTLAKLERRRNRTGSQIHPRRSSGGISMDVMDETLRDFQNHFKSLLTSFGSVILRLSYLVQILRHRISTDPTIVTPSYSSPSSALHSLFVSASVLIKREVKTFLRACLSEDTSVMVRSPVARSMSTSAGVRNTDQGIFSLGIINDASLTTSIREKYAQNLSLATTSNVMRMTPDVFVIEVLCPRLGVSPQIRHALTFRRALSAWTKEFDDLKSELALVSNQDTSSPEYNATTEEDALAYLDGVIKTNLLPMMHEAADSGTISALERRDAFDPIVNPGLYKSAIKGQSMKVEMCAACQGLFTSTGPLFAALPRLPRGGDMYIPIVASLEQAILLFISRVKSRILELCDGKYAFSLIEDPVSRSPTRLYYDMEARKPFARLVISYFGDEDVIFQSEVETAPNRQTINPIAPSASDTKAKNSMDKHSNSSLLPPRSGAVDESSQLLQEQEAFENEVRHLLDLLNFSHPRYQEQFKLSTEDAFLKAASLGHSLLKLASKLDSRLGASSNKVNQGFVSPRSLREAVKNIRIHGYRLAKFCRMEVLLQIVQKISITYKSSSLTSKDVVRIPTSINSLGEYLNSISDQLRDYGGNKIAAYALSSLEQYVPLFLMETVRIIAIGDDLSKDFKITLNGVEALDRCCSVLYRDLKSSTGFDNSFWNDDVAADAFERTATYIGLMELDMDELVSNWRHNRSQFNDEDWRIMFEMNGPRRRGDLARYTALKERTM